RLLHRGEQLGRERQGLLHLRIRVGGRQHRRQRGLRREQRLWLLTGDVVGELESRGRVLRERVDAEVVTADHARAGLAVQTRQRRDGELVADLRLLVERVRVRPVAHERVLAGLERAARLLLLVGDHGLRGGPRLDAVHHQGERLRGLRRVDRGRLTVVGQHLAARRVEQLEVVHGQALVLEALVDDPVLGLRLLVDLVPVAGRLRHLVGAVVEERRVRVERQRPVLALVVRRLERARDELVLARVHRAGHVLEPALRGELGGPHHVHAEHVALRRLGALSLGELVELLGGVLGQLDELGLHVRVRLVVHLHDLLERAGGVLADAPGHAALGVLSGVCGHGAGARTATSASSAGADADRCGAGEDGNSYGSPHVLSSHGLSNRGGYPGSRLLNRLASGRCLTRWSSEEATTDWWRRPTSRARAYRSSSTNGASSWAAPA